MKRWLEFVVLLLMATLCARDVFAIPDVNATSLLFAGVRKTGSGDTADSVIKIGVMTQQGAKKCLAKWGPTAEYLTEQIPQLSFEIVPLTYEQIYPVVAAGQVDFVLATPSIYVELEALYHVGRIATMKNLYSAVGYTFLGGVLFCKAEREDMQNLADLEGKSLIGLHQRACTAWHAVCLELKENGVDPFRDLSEIKFGATGNSVVSAVRNNEVDVGAIRSDSFEEMKLSGLIKPREFRVLHGHSEKHSNVPFAHSTQLFPEKPFAKVRHTPDELAEKVASVLINMSADSLAARASKSLGWTIPHNYQPVHDCLKTLGLSPYEDYGKITLTSIFSQYKPWIITIAMLVVIVLFAAGFIMILNNRLSGAQHVILEHQIMETSDNAYRKFSQSLHDGLGQQLTGIKFMAETLKDKLVSESSEHSSAAKKISELMHGTICQSRDLAKGLDPVELSENDLVLATEVLLRNIENTFNISCVLKRDHSVVFGEGSEAIHLYRIIQEAINNSIKHGKAKDICVTIQDSGEEYVLTIEDDGLGFSNDKLQNEGMGLYIMKYRANAIKAKLEVNNRPGGGVMVRCTLPKKGMA